MNPYLQVKCIDIINLLNIHDILLSVNFQLDYRSRKFQIKIQRTFYLQKLFAFDPEE